MKEDKYERKLTSDINKNTKHGTAALQAGKLDAALKYFESSFKKSLQLGDAFTERACSFNVGAVYISMNNPEQGLAFLQRALPPSGNKDGKSNGDLYYNFGLGYEVLDSPGEAVKYYELALDEYKDEGDNYLMEMEVGKRAGSLYTKLVQWLPASRCYGIAATANSRLGDTEGQTICLCRQASCLHQAGRVETALQAADECSILCQRVKEEPVLGRLYNELGLTYTQCHEFARAATCFELALPLSRAPHLDRHQEAIILQNLGAVYNSLGDYQRAVPLHEAAILIHAELGQRNSQGQCFQNLAFAYSQMDDHEAAGECYLHALQAAKDTEDQHGQWQAMEGLGAVAYNEQKFKRATRYFKRSLKLLSNTDSDQVALQRLQAKHDSALQGSVNGEIPNNNTGKAEEYNRENSFDLEALRATAVHNRIIDERLGFVPQGFGDYNYENDRAFSRASYRNMYSDRSSMLRRSKEDAEDGEPLQSSRHIPKKGKMLGAGLDLERDNADAMLRVTYEENADADIEKFSGQKRKSGGLLREESHDSEDEWRQNMKEISTSSDSEDYEYQERQFPREEVPVRLRRKHKKGLTDILDDEDKWLENYQLSVIKKHNKKRHSKSSGQSPNQSPGRIKPTSENGGAKITKHRHKDDSDSETEEEHHRRNSTESTESKAKEESTEDEEDEDESRHGNTKENNNSSTEGSQSDKKRESNSRALAPPAPPTLSPLGTTYEQPKETSETAASDANFFRPRTPHQQKSEDQHTKTDYDEDEPIYSTLRSVKTLPLNVNKGDLLHPNDSDTHISAVPEVPPRPASVQAREFLQDYQQQRDTHMIKRKNTLRSEGEVQLPSKHAKKNSKICAIM